MCCLQKVAKISARGKHLPMMVFPAKVVFATYLSGKLALLAHFAVF
jgi:hypothetical protein